MLRGLDDRAASGADTRPPGSGLPAVGNSTALGAARPVIVYTEEVVGSERLCREYADNIWSFWVDDASGHNFGRWYGTGTTARGRIGGTAKVTAVQNLQGNGVWDSLVMKMDPAANTTQFFFNGTDLGTLSHASEGTADVVGRVRFERLNNSSGGGQFVYLDNVRVGPN